MRRGAVHLAVDHQREIPAVIFWTTDEHTSVPVPVTAEGPGDDQFDGKHPNTLVHDVLKKILAP